MIARGTGSRWLARFAAGGLAVLAALPGGCVSDEPRDRPPPKQPDWAKPTDLMVSSGFPEDTDGNGYLDRINVVAYLFDNQFANAPLRVPGTFTFMLQTSDGRTITQWNISAADSDAAARPMKAGPGYVFKLSLLDNGSDKIDIRNAELVSLFTPTGGKPVRSKALTVTLGRIGTRSTAAPAGN